MPSPADSLPIRASPPERNAESWRGLPSSGKDDELSCRIDTNREMTPACLSWKVSSTSSTHAGTSALDLDSPRRHRATPEAQARLFLPFTQVQLASHRNGKDHQRMGPFRSPKLPSARARGKLLRNGRQDNATVLGTPKLLCSPSKQAYAARHCLIKRLHSTWREMPLFTTHACGVAPYKNLTARHGQSLHVASLCRRDWTPLRPPDQAFRFVRRRGVAAAATTATRQWS